jgi:hypothetical protein
VAREDTGRGGHADEHTALCRQLMDPLRLRAAFAFDRDVRDCGYAMVP